MAKCHTKYFGEMTYDEGAVWRFPAGLPGFEAEREFLPIEQPATRPLIYLQSLSDRDICFVGLPVQILDSSYRLDMADEDRELIGLSPEFELGPSTNGVLCVALISVRESGTTANLMAPVIANLDTGRAVQAISLSGRYSHQHPVGDRNGVPPCW